MKLLEPDHDHNNEYSEKWVIEEIMRFVWESENIKDAIINLERILKSYEHRKTFGEKLKALFN